MLDFMAEADEKQCLQSRAMILCIHIHTYMCIYIYVSTYACTCTYIHMYVYICTCAYVYRCIHVYMDMYTYVRASFGSSSKRGQLCQGPPKVDAS